MATETLLVKDAFTGQTGPTRQWDPVGAATLVDCVQTNDADTSYVKNSANAAASLNDIDFAFNDPVTIQLGDTINSVTYRFVLRRTGSEGNTYLIADFFGTSPGDTGSDVGSTTCPSTAYQVFDVVYTTTPTHGGGSLGILAGGGTHAGPDAGRAWTAADLFTEQIDIDLGVTDINAGDNYRITYVALIVDYTPAPPPVPPTLNSASVSSDGLHVILGFDVPGTPPLLPSSGITGFTVKANGVSKTINSSTRTDANQVTLVMAAALLHSQTITLSYAPGNLTDTVPTALDSITDLPVLWPSHTRLNQGIALGIGF